MEKVPCFLFLADIHINIPFLFAKRCREFYKAMCTVERHAIDGIYVLGDISDYGLKVQMKAVIKILKKIEKSKMHPIYLMLGNHDLYHVWNDYKSISLTLQETCKQLQHKKRTCVYEEQYMGEFPCLLLGSEKRLKTDCYISNQQQDWINERLQIHKRQPVVFILNHQPLTNSHKGSEELGLGEQDIQMKQILKQYANVIWISGHLHNEPACVEVLSNQFGVQIDIPSFQLTNGEQKHHGCGCFLHVHHQYVDVQIWDFLNDYFIKGFYIQYQTHDITSYT